MLNANGNLNCIGMLPVLMNPASGPQRQSALSAIIVGNANSSGNGLLRDFLMFDGDSLAIFAQCPKRTLGRGYIFRSVAFSSVSGSHSS